MLARYKWRVLACWMLGAVLLAAEAPPAGSGGDAPAITLAEARGRALGAGPDVVLTDLRAQLANTEVEVAGALANPTLALQTARLTAKLTATLGVPLPLFGQRQTAVAAAGAGAEAARLDIDAARLDARWRATHAWLALWEAQEKAALLGAAATETARLADIAKERFAAGTGPRVDVIRTGADRARAQAEASAAATVVAGFAAELAVSLGADTPGSLRAVGPLDLGPLPDESAALARLYAQHPALRRDRAQADAAAARVRAEQRSRWPVVTAELAVAAGDPTLPGTDVVGGVSFEAPVLNQRSGPIARARAEQALAAWTTETELRRLEADLIAGYRQSESAAARVRALTDDVIPALEEARRMTEEGYRDGRVDLLRVLEAQSAVRDARLASVEARAAWQRARADVERAVGALPTGGTSSGS
jgi:cobalt-zinc-cadmium efflux system outer membrane protein